MFNEDNATYILREYIDFSMASRHMVVGDNVVAAAKFKFSLGDFRNVSVFNRIEYEKSDFSEKVNEIAVGACKSLNLQVFL